MRMPNEAWRQDSESKGIAERDVGRLSKLSKPGFGSDERLQHSAGVDAELIHAGNKRGPFDSQARSGAIVAADATFGIA